MKAQDMTQRYRKFKRAWGMWYAFDNATGNSVSLKTRVQAEAVQKVNAMNETERVPGISLGLARVYLNATDPKLATRTWQDVMENIVAKKAGETRRRWETAIKDRNFDCIRRSPVAETRPEHFDRALADGKVSTNVYLRRIHNHALGMEWLLKSVIPRLQWPKSVFKSKRAITAEEHAAIVQREQNSERRDFYELLWHSRSGSRNRRWGTTPRRCIGRMRNTQKSPCRRWRIGKRIGRKIRNGACKQTHISQIDFTSRS
jgi:hypothetical protein